MAVHVFRRPLKASKVQQPRQTNRSPEATLASQVLHHVRSSMSPELLKNIIFSYISSSSYQKELERFPWPCSLKILLQMHIKISLYLSHVWVDDPHLPKNNECLRVKRGGYRSTHPVWLVWQATEASEPKQWPRPLLTYGQQSRLESATKPNIKRQNISLLQHLTQV